MKLTSENIWSESFFFVFVFFWKTIKWLKGNPKCTLTISVASNQHQIIEPLFQTRTLAKVTFFSFHQIPLSLTCFCSFCQFHHFVFLDLLSLSIFLSSKQQFWNSFSISTSRLSISHFSIICPLHVILFFWWKNTISWLEHGSHESKFSLLK